jgi:hypothetical protein
MPPSWYLFSIHSGAPGKSRKFKRTFGGLIERAAYNSLLLTVLGLLPGLARPACYVDDHGDVPSSNNVRLTP